MANEEHLAILRQGVEVWNKWRKQNPKTQPDLSQTDLSESSLAEANLRRAEMLGTTLIKADLRKAKLDGAYLARAQLQGANLTEATLIRTNLSQANLSNAELRIVTLTEAILWRSCLERANFTNSLLLRANLTRAKLTGACIQDWNINGAKLDGIDCQYIYFRNEKQERRPRNGKFNPGDFTNLYQKAFETVDLIFTDGIDWEAFLLSLQELRDEYGEDNLIVQGIEKKSSGAFVIRLEVPSKVNKAEIEQKAKERYNLQLKDIEAKYHAELKAKDEQIVIVRQQNTSFESIIYTLASKPIQNIINVTAKAENNPMSNNYDLSNTKFGGGFAGTEGTQSGGTFYDYSSNQNLAETAAQIQQLLEQLDKTYATETTTGKMTIATEAIKRIENDPTFKERVLSALKAGGTQALAQLLNHPAASFVIGALDDWQKTKD